MVGSGKCKVDCVINMCSVDYLVGENDCLSQYFYLEIQLCNQKQKELLLIHTKLMCAVRA